MMPSAESPLHHVEETRPSTSGSESSVSTLSPPPKSPSIRPAAAMANQVVVHDDDADEFIFGDIESNAESPPPSDLKDGGSGDEEIDIFISAYLARQTQYYDDHDEEDVEDSVESKEPTDSDTPKVEIAENISQENSTSVNEPSPSSTILVGTGEVALPVASNPRQDSEVPPKSSAPINSKANKKRYGFPKLTPIEDFETFLANPEDMSYDKLYQRSAQVADAMVQIQTEYFAIEEELRLYEEDKKSKAKEEEEAAKVLNEERQKEEDEKLAALHRKFYHQIKGPSPAWKQFLEDFETKNADEPAGTLELVRSLRNPSTLAGVNKRQQKEKAKPAQPPLELINTPLPVEKKDTTKRRKLFEDPIKFDDQKMADVYGFKYSEADIRYGNQDLRDRNNPDANGDGLNENGRPQRNKAKRTVYDTDQGEAADSTSEELPAKRRRTQRIPDDMLGSPSRTQTASQSRDVSPGGGPRTFKSGKRIGRPPGSKTKPKAQPSKLQTVMPAPSQTPEPDTATHSPRDSYRGTLESESLPPGLSPVQEAALHNASALLNTQLQHGHSGSAILPVKKKHAGGRPRKNPLPESSTAATTGLPAQTDSATRIRNAGGRPKKRSAPDTVESDDDEPEPRRRRGGRPKRESVARNDYVQLGDENDVMQSTEQDDVSRFDSTSASTSRPTTSSSNATASSGSRRVTRQSTREVSRSHFPMEAEMQNPFTAQGLSITTKVGKRKRAETIGSTIAVDNREFIAAESPVPRKRKMGKALATLMEPMESPDSSSKPPASRRGRQKTQSTVKVESNDSKYYIGDFNIYENLLPQGVHPSESYKLPKKAKSKGKAKLDEVDIDNLDPDELEEHKKKKEAQIRKSEKLSEATKKRWANGGMTAAMEKRAATNAKKKADKEAKKAALSGNLAIATNPTNQPTMAAYQLGTQPIDAPVLPINREKRARKPTKKLLGLDGAADDDEEIEKQFTNEYDRFQALTSPQSPVVLGKRARKSMIDLAAALDEDEDWL